MDKASQDRNSIFGMIFLLAQRWQTLGDRVLKEDGLTTKQWLLLVTLGSLKSETPSLNELTDAFGTSRQNVKQLALQLEKRGFLEITRDPTDARVLRFRITEANDLFWKGRTQQDIAFIESLYGDLDPKALKTTAKTINELMRISGELIMEDNQS